MFSFFFQTASIIESVEEIFTITGALSFVSVILSPSSFGRVTVNESVLSFVLS